MLMTIPSDPSSKVVNVPWHLAFPLPRCEAQVISGEDVLKLLQSSENTTIEKDFVLVDLRKGDHQGGTIRGSLNIPAQTLYPSIPTFYALFKAAGVKRIIWYCGSSQGRGSRAAAWFSDYITEQRDDEMKSLRLLGGIKGWVDGGDEYLQWMDGFDQAVWNNYA